MLLPALGGDVRCYADLVQQLGDDQPVYAFRPRGVDQDLPPHLTMDEMIADYAAALRELQPAGPYYLAGWSTGGIFAFALAEALERAGDEVALVAMFDSPLPSICDDVDVEDDARFLCDLVNFANRFAGHRRAARLRRVVCACRRTSGSQPRWPRRGGEACAGRDAGVVHPPVGPRRRSQCPRDSKLSSRADLRRRCTCSCRQPRAGWPRSRGARRPMMKTTAGRRRSGSRLELQELPGDHFTMMLGESAAASCSRLCKITRARRRRLAATIGQRMTFRQRRSDNVAAR